MAVTAAIERVTSRIVAGRPDSRAIHMRRMAAGRRSGTARRHGSCTNLAPVTAATAASDTLMLREQDAPDLATLSACGDMLSAHQPSLVYPDGYGEPGTPRPCAGGAGAGRRGAAVGAMLLPLMPTAPVIPVIVIDRTEDAMPMAQVLWRQATALRPAA